MFSNVQNYLHLISDFDSIRTVQSLINENLYQVMVLSQSDTAAQVLESLSKIETELAKMDMAHVEQFEATENLTKELHETLDVLVNIVAISRDFNIKV